MIARKASPFSSRRVRSPSLKLWLLLSLLLTLAVLPFTRLVKLSFSDDEVKMPSTSLAPEQVKGFSDNHSYRLHRRQLIVGPNPIKEYDDWECIDLKTSDMDKMYICYCSTLPVEIVRDQTGRCSWMLVGDAIDERQEESPTRTLLSTVALDDILVNIWNWSGRWLLIGHGKAYSSTLGLLGLYYGKDHKGRLWSSTSPSLLKKILTKYYNGESPKDLGPPSVFDWYILPSTRHEGISKQLPSQILDLSNGSVQPRRLLPPNPPKTFEEAVDEFVQRVSTSLRRLDQMDNRKILLGLSGGRDSRAILALGRCAGVEMDLFTRVQKGNRTSLCDRVLPQILSAKLGMQHEMRYHFDSNTRVPNISLDLAALAKNHTAKQVVDRDRVPLEEQTRAGLTGVAIGGHGFQGFRYGTKSRHQNISLPSNTTLFDLYGAFKDKPVYPALAQWFDWIIENPEKDMLFFERFFVEQLSAGWQAGKEQLYDLEPLVRYFLLSSGRTISILFKAANEHWPHIQHAVIQRCTPELSDIPVNPTDQELGEFLRTYNNGQYTNLLKCNA